MIQYYQSKKGLNFMEIDLHGMDVKEAEGHLKGVVEFCTDGELTVIHGCHSGNRLKDMVQNRFNHKKIKRKIKTLNGGITIFELRQDK